MSEQELSLILERAGILPTAQRIDIARVLLGAARHLSADQVSARLQVRGSPVSKATVYNTLGLFAAKGLVREVIIDPAKVFYDSNVSAHHHFYNVDTGTLTDIDANDIVLAGVPNVPEGTEVCGVEVIVRVRGATPTESG